MNFRICREYAMHPYAYRFGFFREIQLPYSTQDWWYCSAWGWALHKWVFDVALLEFDNLGLNYQTKETHGQVHVPSALFGKPSNRLLQQQAFFSKQILVVRFILLWLQTQESGTPSSARTTRVAGLNSVILGGSRDDFGWGARLHQKLPKEWSFFGCTQPRLLVLSMCLPEVRMHFSKVCKHPLYPFSRSLLFFFEGQQRWLL